MAASDPLDPPPPGPDPVAAPPDEGAPGAAKVSPYRRLDPTHLPPETGPTAQMRSAAYRLAFLDRDFLLRDELRPVRLQLELLKPELVQREEGVYSTIVVFGSARIPDPEAAKARLEAAEGALAAHRASGKPADPALEAARARAARDVENSRYYAVARDLGRIVTATCQSREACHFVVVTGGGPGIMEAANRGAADVQGKSVGLSIVLPAEQRPNGYISPNLSFQFHYFAIRKMHFLMRARALVCCPGGFGTLDELFEALTLVQTGKIAPIPIILVGRSFWERLVDWKMLAERGMISPGDLDLITFVDTAEEAWDAIARAQGIEASAPIRPDVYGV